MTLLPGQKFKVNAIFGKTMFKNCLFHLMKPCEKIFYTCFDLSNLIGHQKFPTNHNFSNKHNFTREDFF